VNYVGIDWAYGRTAWCAVSERGAIQSEGLIPPTKTDSQCSCCGWAPRSGPAWR
jgi:hypothetical protein